MFVCVCVCGKRMQVGLNERQSCVVVAEHLKLGQQYAFFFSNFSFLFFSFFLKMGS